MNESSEKEWVTCADCGAKRAASTLAGRENFVCRHCLGMNAVPVPVEQGSGLGCECTKTKPCDTHAEFPMSTTWDGRLADAPEKVGSVKGLADKIALTVRLLTAVQAPEEKTKAQNVLSDLLIQFAEEIKRQAMNHE